MALVGYESSDEDEDVQAPHVTKALESAEVADADSNDQNNTNTHPEPVSVTALAPSISNEPSMIGPMRPSEDTSSLQFPPLEEAPTDEPPALSLPPGSPYSANRALLRDLTLPTVPNMDIPSSPPGSPSPGSNKKFEQFLELKKKGIHFNSKIAQSVALRNPSLMDKLMKFAEIDQKDQYRTTLGTDLWDPTDFPKLAYKEQLRQSQVEIGQAKARPRGAPVDFVAASGTNSRQSTPGVTQVPATSTGKRKTRFDT